IRTVGPAEKETAVERGPAADHRCLARRPVFNDPIQLIGPASLVVNSRETFHKSGTDGSNPVPSSGESGELPYCAAGSSRSRRTPRNSVHRFTRLRHHFIPQQTPSAPARWWRTSPVASASHGRGRRSAL